MHGRLIVLLPKGEEKKVEDFYEVILNGIGADYIGDRIFGSDAESTYERFTTALNSIDTGTMSVKDSMEYLFDYPVAIIDGYPTVFRSFVEYKAYCDLYGLWFGDYDWQIWDFHF